MHSKYMMETKIYYARLGGVSKFPYILYLPLALSAPFLNDTLFYVEENVSYKNT